MKDAGFSWRPYVLRSYCDTAFDIAESKGFISHPWRQFFMGHKGDIEARYSTNKGRLPPDMVEEMRGAYKRCENLLQTSRAEPEQETFREQLLLVAGFKRDEVEKMDLAQITNEQLQDSMGRSSVPASKGVLLGQLHQEKCHLFERISFVCPDLLDDRLQFPMACDSVRVCFLDSYLLQNPAVDLDKLLDAQILHSSH